MLFYVFSLSFLFWQSFAAILPDPVITAAPFRPTHENLRRQSMLLAQRRLAGRALPTSTIPEEVVVEELAYCYGENSICAETNVLHDQCEQANRSTLSNYTGMFICECESGYFAADQECGWCELGFEPYLTYIYNVNSGWSSICSSLSVTFAPVPASGVAVVSAWNATFTGITSYNGGGGGATSSPGSESTSSNSGSRSSSTSSRNIFAGSTTTDTLFGGGGGQTTAPPRTTTSGTAQPSSTPNGSPSIEHIRGSGTTMLVVLWSVMAWLLL